MNEFHKGHVSEFEHFQALQTTKETRVHFIRMRIACLCYSEYKEGSSKRKFENEVQKAVLNGLDMGDINHSSEFYLAFMSFVSTEVSDRLKTFFNSRID